MSTTNPLYTELKRRMAETPLHGVHEITGVIADPRKRQRLYTFIARWNDGLYHGVGQPDTTFRATNHEDRLLLLVQVE